MSLRRFRIESSALVPAFLAALAVPVAAEESAAKGKTEEKAAKKSGAREEGGGGNGAAAETFTVVQVGRTVTILKNSEVAEYRKEVAAEYDESVKAYNEAKKKAAKAKKKFEDAKPERPVVKVIASSLKNEETANSIRQKTLAGIEKKRKKEVEERSKAKQKAG